MSKIVGLKEFRENTASFLSQIKKGKSFLVLKKSKPAFLASPPVDEWGDEGTWKTIIDFRKIRKGGVPAEEVLMALKRLNEQDRKISKKTRSK